MGYISKVQCVGIKKVQWQRWNIIIILFSLLYNQPKYVVSSLIMNETFISIEGTGSP